MYGNLVTMNTVYKWYEQFKSEHEQKTNDNRDVLRRKRAKMVCSNKRLTILEVLTDNLHMRKESMKCVPTPLTDEEKGYCVSVFTQLKDRFIADSEFMAKIITGMKVKRIVMILRQKLIVALLAPTKHVSQGHTYSLPSPLSLSLSLSFLMQVMFINNVYIIQRLINERNTQIIIYFLFSFESFEVYSRKCKNLVLSISYLNFK